MERNPPEPGYREWRLLIFLQAFFFREKRPARERTTKPLNFIQTPHPAFNANKGIFTSRDFYLRIRACFHGEQTIKRQYMIVNLGLPVDKHTSLDQNTKSGSWTYVDCWQFTRWEFQLPITKTEKHLSVSTLNMQCQLNTCLLEDDMRHIIYLSFGKHYTNQFKQITTPVIPTH